MKLIAILLFFTASVTVKAQISPADLQGHWEGTLSWYKQGKKEASLHKMQLKVFPADTLGQYTWQLIYGEDGKDNRPYILKPVDSVKGHWVVDEKNSILLDQFIVGNRFCGTFTVGNFRIANCYWFENEDLVVEFMTTSVQPVTTSGGVSADIPKVESFTVHGYQRAVLKRRK